jgi:hypothetical protein
MFQLFPNNRDFRSQTRVGYLRYAGVQSISHGSARVCGSGVARHQEVTQFVPATFHQKFTDSDALLFGGLFSHVTPRSRGRTVLLPLTHCVSTSYTRSV